MDCFLKKKEEEETEASGNQLEEGKSLESSEEVSLLGVFGQARKTTSVSSA